LRRTNNGTRKLNNNVINLDSKKRRHFIALRLAVCYGER
jgi:hypothetical protein